MKFADNFREKCFIDWYNAGKPPMASFMHMVKTDDQGDTPSKQTLDVWLRKEWRDRADILDEEVKIQLSSKLIAEKVEMLKRHAVVGKKMQDIALDYLDDPNIQEKLSPNSALRLLVEGLKTERISVGMPDVLEEVMTKTDEELLEDITKLITEGSSEIIIDHDRDELSDM